MNLNEVLEEKQLSPMMKQYIKCKLQYADCFLFYRLGDFYELFFEDALQVSKLLELTLTGRNCGLDEKAPMCGVPARSVNLYTTKLVEMGYKVAIAEQLKNSKDSPELVERDVIRIVTPGMNFENESNDSNYLMSLYKEEDYYGLSYVDVYSGNIYSTKVTYDLLLEELTKIRPVELIYENFSFDKQILDIINTYNIYCSKVDNLFLDLDIIYEYFGNTYLKTIEFQEKSSIQKNSIVLLLNYISYTQKTIAHNIDTISFYQVNKYMVLDPFTRESLELTSNMSNGEKVGSLFYILDATKTAMGSRLLRKIIEEPLLDMKEIKYRQNLIEELVLNNFTKREITSILNQVYDLERLCGKIAFENINPRELLNLKKSISFLPKLKYLITKSSLTLLKEYIQDLDTLEDLCQLIEDSICEEPNVSITEGNIIKSSYNETLNHYCDVLTHMSEKVTEIEEAERKKYNTRNLRINKNNSDGYYIEITKNTLKTITLNDSYTKVKDLTNASRFTCPELKQLEYDILEANDKSTNLEYELFIEIRSKLNENISRIKEVANILSFIDVLCSLAEVAIRNDYVKPELNTSGKFEIINGRHPIVEKMNAESFISNNTTMNRSDNMIHLITGPNMSGKSTYMRQVVLITLMAQIGSFVPCEKANLSICDRLFTRIGASDNLSQGDSTFMVEMKEVSQILNKATSKSLIILDEVGRGTSTYDGISLAWAIVEYIQEHIKCPTLFATHYFELTELSNELKEVKNYTVQIEETKDEIKFLRKIIPGFANKSYGIYVAQLANLPSEVLSRARKVLEKLETPENVVEPTIPEEKYVTCSEIKEDSFKEEFLKWNLLSMSPLEVFNKVFEFQQKLKE